MVTVITSMRFYYIFEAFKKKKKKFFNPYKNKTHTDMHKFVFLLSFSLTDSRFQKTHPVSSYKQTYTSVPESVIYFLV